MRLSFPNNTRPKKAAKAIAAILGLHLWEAQRGVARACGYQDWHEFEKLVMASPPSPLDQDLTTEDMIARHTALSVKLADALAIPNGDAQYALAHSRLTGDRTPQLNEQIAIRLACFRATTLLQAVPRSPGAVGKLKSPGRNGEVVILLQRSHVTEVISHDGVGTVANFEYVSPRATPPLFLPMRLYLPYGVWTEHDGAQVLFSRDYNPLWRVLPDGKVERLAPWLRIKFEHQTWWWNDAGTPWRKPQLQAELEDRLLQMGITGLPILADGFPLLLNKQSARKPQMRDIASLLKEMREPRIEVKTA